MQVNSINSHPSFGARIPQTAALERFVDQLITGNGCKCYSYSQQDIVKNFDIIHKLFPGASDIISFKTFSSHVGGDNAASETTRIVQGVVDSRGVQAPFSFSYKENDLLGNYDAEKNAKIIPHMETALREAKSLLERARVINKANNLDNNNPVLSVIRTIMGKNN